MKAHFMECSVNELPLSAFFSPNVLSYLVDHYNIAPVTTPMEDMEEMLGKSHK